MESDADTDAATEADAGRRLAGQARRLRLLVLHLAGRAILARVEADDLVQEVYLRALSAPGGLPPEVEGEAALSRFLGRVARNAVIDAARAIRAAKRQGREVPLERSAWSRVGGARAPEPSAHGPGPATLVAGHETEERLVRAWQALAPDHRRVIGLRQFRGLSAAEAAQRLGRSEAAVHSLYRRALEAWEQGLPA